MIRFLSNSLHKNHPTSLFSSLTNGIHTYDFQDLRRTSAAVQVPKAPKRSIRDPIKLASRIQEIQAGLASQEKRLADYKKTLPAKSRNRGILYLLKKNAWEK